MDNREIENIEKSMSFKFPKLYHKFLTELGNSDGIEVKNSGLYLYGSVNLLERNETYEVQKYEPNFFMIGQDGNRGYFVNIPLNNDIIYFADLGAIGSIEMEKAANNIFELMEQL